MDLDSCIQNWFVPDSKWGYFENSLVSAFFCRDIGRNSYIVAISSSDSDVLSLGYLWHNETNDPLYLLFVP